MSVKKNTISVSDFKKENLLKFSKGKKNRANALTKSVLDYMTMQGFKVWRQNNIAAFDAKIKSYRKFTGLKGVADVIGYCKSTGVFVAVEVKAGKDTLSPEQKIFLADSKNAGCMSFCCVDNINALIYAVEDFRSHQEEKEKCSNCCSASFSEPCKNMTATCDDCGEGCDVVDCE